MTISRTSSLFAAGTLSLMMAACTGAKAPHFECSGLDGRTAEIHGGSGVYTLTTRVVRADGKSDEQTLFFGNGRDAETKANAFCRAGDLPAPGAF